MRGSSRPSIYAREKPKTDVKPVIIMTPTPMELEDRSLEPIYPDTLNRDGTSIIDVAMNLW